MQKLVVLWR